MTADKNNIELKMKNLSKADVIGKVVSINTSENKGTKKNPVEMVKLIKNFGLEGDSHAGAGIRQVSFLAIESYRRFEKLNNYKTCLKHGSFGENIITEGIELYTLPIGTRLVIGNTILEVSKIGKECHAPCGIAKTVGGCIMPKEGIFARVVAGGIISNGDEINIISK